MGQLARESTTATAPAQKFDMTEHFLTVHDLQLSPDEAAIWGGVGRMPDTYPANPGMHPQDAALCHMVDLLLDRGDATAAAHYADLIMDPRLQAVMWAVVGNHRRRATSTP